MASQRALRLLECTPLPGPGATGEVEATLELGCGCVVTRRLAADRIVRSVDGVTLVVGKFSCREHTQVS